jgi:hypothetical protein
MTSFDANNYRKIALYYIELGEKKLLKKSLSSLNINKKVFLFYSKGSNIPICALPRLKTILSSRNSFLSFCYNFFSFVNNYETVISISPSSIKSVAKFVISHEVGHILDPDIYKAKQEYAIILSSIIDTIIQFDIDVNSEDFHKGNLPLELDNSILDLKKNLIDRESKAWDIAKAFLVFENSKEEFLFNKMREYALATYNFGGLKNIVKEHNLDIYFKRRKYLA